MQVLCGYKRPPAFKITPKAGLEMPPSGSPAAHDADSVAVSFAQRQRRHGGDSDDDDDGAATPRRRFDYVGSCDSDRGGYGYAADHSEQSTFSSPPTADTGESTIGPMPGPPPPPLTALRVATGATGFGAAPGSQRGVAPAKGNGKGQRQAMGKGQGHQRRQHKERKYRVHSTLSRVTNTRRRCLPFDGTFDIWILAGITGLDLFAAAWGLKRLAGAGAFSSFGGGYENVLWLGVIFALVDAIPGLYLLVYLAVYERAPWVMRVWVPFVVTVAIVGSIAIEVRLAVGYITGSQAE